MAADVSPMIDALNQVLQPPFQVVQRELDYQWIFATGHEPSETLSDDEPPFRFEERTEAVVIDGLLGQYEPISQKITIFQKGIKCVSRSLNANAQDLKFIVRLHEWAHALLHIGFSKNDCLSITSNPSSWPEYLARATAEFRNFDIGLGERLPQLITHRKHSFSSGTTADSPKARAIFSRMADSFSASDTAPAR